MITFAIMEQKIKDYLARLDLTVDDLTPDELAQLERTLRAREIPNKTVWDGFGTRTILTILFRTEAKRNDEQTDSD